MTKKIGRPKIENPKQNVFVIRLTKSETDTLKRLSDAANQSKSEIMRYALRQTARDILEEEIR